MNLDPRSMKNPQFPTSHELKHGADWIHSLAVRVAGTVMGINFPITTIWEFQETWHEQKLPEPKLVSCV